MKLLIDCQNSINYPSNFPRLCEGVDNKLENINEDNDVLKLDNENSVDGIKNIIKNEKIVIRIVKYTNKPSLCCCAIC